METEMERSRFLIFVAVSAYLACVSALSAFEAAIMRPGEAIRWAFDVAFPSPEPSAALRALAARPEPVQRRAEVSAFLMRLVARWPARKGPWGAGQGPALSLA